MPRSVHIAIAWIGGILLLLGQFDFWREQQPVLHFGWLPEELLWRLGWMAAALAYLCHFCRCVWGREP
jgi:hypothetical protein